MQANRTRRALVLGLGSAPLLKAGWAHAQAYPVRPIHVVVIVAPGGTGDAVARMIGEPLSRKLGQPVVVENKPGAGGNVASQYVSRADPDGYTLLLSANNHTLNPTLYPNAGYRLEDFEPIAALTESPSVICVPVTSPYQTLADLLDDARRSPMALSFGSAGVGTPSHVAGEVLQREADVRFTHVAYRGSGPSITDTLSGQLSMVVATLGAVLPHVQGGKLRALAVTSAERSALLPDVPTVVESGIAGYAHLTWTALFAPAGTPPQVVSLLHDTVQAVLADPSVQAFAAKLGGTVVLQDRADFVAQIQRDAADSAQWVRAANLKVE